MADAIPATDARVLARLYEVFRDLPRGGPGDPDSMRRALAFMTDLPARPRVLDLGCGPGSSSIQLARLTGGRVIAFDLHAPFVTRQTVSALESEGTGAVDGVCGDMGAAPFARSSFDLAWSEGALYSIGFRNGLRVCADLVRPRGYLAASEAVWTVRNPPAEVRSWWDIEYPDIGTIDRKLADVQAAGFAIAGHFTLPVSSWLDHYYTPMRTRLAALRESWADDEIGLGLIAQLDHEVSMFEQFGHTYGYEFIVGRRVAGERWH